jgi:hypothetical protein
MLQFHAVLLKNGRRQGTIGPLPSEAKAHDAGSDWVVEQVKTDPNCPHGTYNWTVSTEVA